MRPSSHCREHITAVAAYSVTVVGTAHTGEWKTIETNNRASAAGTLILSSLEAIAEKSGRDVMQQQRAVTQSKLHTSPLQQQVTERGDEASNENIPPHHRLRVCDAPVTK